MKTLPALLAATVLLSPAALAAPSWSTEGAQHAKVSTWTISTKGVGKLRLGMTVKAAKKVATFKHGDCFPELTGELARSLAPSFSGNKLSSKLEEIDVTRKSSTHYRFVTKGGTHVGTTVAKLKKNETGLTRSKNSVYEHGFIYYKHTAKHRWANFVVNDGKVTAIDIAIYKITGGGGC